MLIWITGASKGIGRALALEYAARGCTVAVSARTGAQLDSLRTEALKNGHPGAIHPFVLDVTDAAACERAVGDIESALGPIDQAILNAGTHRPVSVQNFSGAPFHDLMGLNFFGVLNTLEPLMSRFRARRGGTVGVVSSLAGYVGLPGACAYGAGKAALINMCEALKVELDREGVALKLICPGFVKTPLTDQNDFPMPFVIPAERAARHIADGMGSKRFEIVFPFAFAVCMKLLRALPYRLLWPLTRRMVR